MKPEIKVGDTFRVFEVVVDIYCGGLLGNQTTEVKDEFYKDKFGINTFLSVNRIKNLHYPLSDLKQVGTIRIKSLKDSKDELICDNCRYISGFYHGTTCPKCKRSFRDVKPNR